MFHPNLREASDLHCVGSFSKLLFVCLFKSCCCCCFLREKRWGKGYPELEVVKKKKEKRIVNYRKRSPAACDLGVLPSRVFAPGELGYEAAEGISCASPWLGPDR